MKKALLFLSVILTSSLLAQEAFDIDFNQLAVGKSFTQQVHHQFTRNGDGSDLIVLDEGAPVLRLEASTEMGTPAVVIQTKDQIFGPFSGKIKASVEIRPGSGVHLVGFYQSREEAMRRALVKFEAKEIMVHGEEGTGGVIGAFEEGKWYRVEFEIEAGGPSSNRAYYNIQVIDLQGDVLVAGTSANVLATGNPEFISGGVLQVGVKNGEAASADFRHWKIRSEKTEE